MTKFILLCLMPVLTFQGSSPLLTSKNHEVHHVILLLDRSGSMIKGNNLSENRNLNSIYYLVKRELPKLIFENNRFLKNRALLDQTKGDYLTVISFGKGSRERDLRRFIQDIPSPFDKSQRYLSDYNSDTFNTLANHLIDPIRQMGEPDFDFFNRYQSIISLAMPMALYDLRRDDGTVVVHRTFVVFITDELFNGGDPNQELQVITGLTSKERTRVIEIYRSIQSSFVWSAFAGKQQSLQSGLAKIRVFEFTPIAKEFAIESLIRFNSGELFFKRQPGNFHAQFTLTPTNQSSDFFIAEIQARLVDANGALVGNNQKMLLGLTQQETLDFQIDNSQAGSNLTLDLRFVVNWREENYGIHQLHPDGGKLQGAAGLKRTIPATYESPLYIWGWFPINSGLFTFTTWFWGNSQQDVQLFWQAASVGLLVLAFILFFVKVLHYLRTRSHITEEAINVEQINFD